jgi:AAA domain
VPPTTPTRKLKRPTVAQQLRAALKRMAEAPRPADVRRAADVPSQPVQWLWPGRIPIGKVTLLIGDPGLGKSLIALDVAGRVSTGAAWPDEERAARSEDRDDLATQTLAPRSSLLAPSSVLILSAEDDLADTIRPRLDAHGAEAGRVFTLSSLADLRRDFAQLQSAVNGLDDCRLIIVDPINAYVGPAESHFHSVVQRVLTPLAKLAKQKRLAVLAIAHLRKLDGAAIHRAAGSIGYVAAARAVWAVCPDPLQPGRRFFVALKNNLNAESTPLAYTIQPHAVLGAPAIRWEPCAAVNADEVLTPPSRRRGPERDDRRHAAIWLRKILASGPQLASDVIADAQDHGLHIRVVQRAFHDIGGCSRKLGLFAGWEWSLSESGSAPQKLATPTTQNSATPTKEKPVAFEETSRLREPIDANR